jgi:hypothetical protein
MTILERECQGKAACLPPHCNWLGLGLRHTGLGRASLTQKLARARLRPARFRPVDEDH